MGEVKVTRDFFLWCMTVIYLFAFASLYHQIPGLYSDSGVLPAKKVIPLDRESADIKRKATETPTLVWLAPLFGLDVTLMMELLALLGVVVSFGAMIWGRFRDCANFALLWMFYFSLYQVGQTFMWFQWDLLLLEAGFLAIIVAPLGLMQKPDPTSYVSSLHHSPHDNVTMWLVRWLLFRLMFSSGVVKLTSECPTWWSLTALTVHFESQCIPTALAWFAHHLPAWLLQLGVVGTYAVEMAVPFLFFVPIRSIRVFSFYAQMLLQVMILLTGNYNFFNLLTMVLCISVVDDHFWLQAVGRCYSGSKGTGGMTFRWMRYLLVKATEIVVYGGLVYWTCRLFSVRLLPDWSVESKVAFSQEEFRAALSKIVPVTVCMAFLSLTGNVVLSVSRSLSQEGVFKKLWSLFGTVFFAGVAFYMLGISLVPYTALDAKARDGVWPILKQWHSRVDRFAVTSSYGLFRRMTGVGGRPELVVEGSNSLNAGWKEYHFLYKPGSLSQCPPYVFPHQPRLDWQMWFAALGTYQQNPWFVSLVYRLLTNQPEVLDLLDKSRNPFPDAPPKYVRATLYTYSFAPFEASDRRNRPGDWWRRTRAAEYLPVVSNDHRPLLDFLKSAEIPVENRRYVKVSNSYAKSLLAAVRRMATAVTAPTFIWLLFGTGMTINIVTPLFWG